VTGKNFESPELDEVQARPCAASITAIEPACCIGNSCSDRPNNAAVHERVSAQKRTKTKAAQFFQRADRILKLIFFLSRYIFRTLGIWPHHTPWEAVESNSSDLKTQKTIDQTRRAWHGLPMEKQLSFAESPEAKSTKPSPEKTWKPYARNNGSMRYWLSIRNALRYPLQRTLCHVSGSNFTVGEILILILLSGATAYTCYYTMDMWLHTTGELPTILLALTFATAARNSIITFLLGVPFERALFWHKTFAVLAVVSGAFPHMWSVVHTWGLDLGREEEFSGTILLGAMALLILTAPIRYWFFRTFLALHFLFLITAAVFAVVHGAGAALIGVGLWVADFVFRYAYSVGIANPTRARLSKSSKGVTKISIDAATYRFIPGQYMFICIPQLGFFDWHPFSISVDDQDSTKVAFYVKNLGDWTERLMHFVDEAEGDVDAKILCEGPYGSPRLDLEGSRYRNFCLVSGGIGVTPNAFMAQRLMEEKKAGRAVENVRFCWTAAQNQDFNFLEKHLQTWTSDGSLALSANFFCRASRDLETKPIQQNQRLELVRKRMDMEKELANMAREIEIVAPNHITYVAVLVCGPSSLEKAALDACHTCSTKHVKFHFQCETFRF